MRVISIVNQATSKLHLKRKQNKNQEQETHVFGSPPIDSLASKSRIHRHHQRSPIDIGPDQEAMVATFFALETLAEAYSSKASRKSICSFSLGGLSGRKTTSTVASSIPNEAPMKYMCRKGRRCAIFTVFILPWPAYSGRTLAASLITDTLPDWISFCSHTDIRSGLRIMRSDASNMGLKDPRKG